MVELTDLPIARIDAASALFPNELPDSRIALVTSTPSESFRFASEPQI
jgi:hypothetical protein